MYPLLATPLSVVLVWWLRQGCVWPGQCPSTWRFGFPAVLRASPSCTSQAVPSGELLFTATASRREGLAQFQLPPSPWPERTTLGQVFPVPSLSPVPREHCNAFCRMRPSALPFPAALRHCTLNFPAQKMGINAEKCTAGPAWPAPALQC